MKKSLLCLVVVILIISACGNPPLVAPETDVLPTQVTPTSSIAAASPATEEKTLEPSPTPANSGQVEYSAEKISLAPVDLRLKLPEVSAQDKKTSQINFGGWSNKGRRFTFAILFSDDTAEQWITNIDGTGLQRILESGLCGLRSWSPDDSQLLCYKRKNDGFPKDELWVIQLDTNKWVKLDKPPGVKIGDSDVYGGDQIVWLDEQHLLYPTYSKSEPVGRHLWLHDVQNQEIIEVSIDKALKNKAWRDLKLAPNKNSIVGGIGTPNDTLWLGKLVKENEQWQLDYVKTIVSGDIISPYWSPDSSKLAVKSLEQSKNVLQIINLQSNEKLEIPFPYIVASVDWSPDNHTLIVSNYGSGAELPNPIYVVNVDGSNLRELGTFFFGGIKWSPDGQYLSLLIPKGESTNNPFGILKVEVIP